MPARCPTCGHEVVPVYCAASTPERPLLLAWTFDKAVQALGVTEWALRQCTERWRDGWRVVPQGEQRCRYCGERRIWRRSALANHEVWCQANPGRRS